MEEGIGIIGEAITSEMVKSKRLWTYVHVEPHHNLSDAINALENGGFTMSCTPLLGNDGRLHWAILGWKEK